MTTFNCYKVVDYVGDGILKSCIIHQENSVVYGVGIVSTGLRQGKITTPLFAFDDLWTARSWASSSQFRRVYSAIGRYPMKGPERILDAGAAENREMLFRFWKRVKDGSWETLTRYLDWAPTHTVFYRSIELVALVNKDF